MVNEPAPTDTTPTDSGNPFDDPLPSTTALITLAARTRLFVTVNVTAVAPLTVLKSVILPCAEFTTTVVVKLVACAIDTGTSNLTR